MYRGCAGAGQPRALGGLQGSEVRRGLHAHTGGTAVPCPGELQGRLFLGGCMGTMPESQRGLQGAAQGRVWTGVHAHGSGTTARARGGR